MFGGEPDNDDWTCEHCGRRLSIEDTFHTCPQGQKKFEEDNRKADAAYKGKGRATVNIELELDIFDSQDAFDAAMDSLSVEFFLNIMKSKVKNYEAKDSLLDFKVKGFMMKTPKK